MSGTVPRPAIRVGTWTGWHAAGGRPHHPPRARADTAPAARPVRGRPARSRGGGVTACRRPGASRAAHATPHQRTPVKRHGGNNAAARIDRRQRDSRHRAASRGVGRPDPRSRRELTRPAASEAARPQPSAHGSGSGSGSGSGRLEPIRRTRRVHQASHYETAESVSFRAENHPPPHRRLRPPEATRRRPLRADPKMSPREPGPDRARRPTGHSAEVPYRRHPWPGWRAHLVNRAPITLTAPPATPRPKPPGGSL
ncbi:hypothetical protein HNR73_005980 [Phytomonospora endophytica]|uniref:Uncharacterized protein n=1 Tax=Phytomonospora endophytica TaxID=714109 RepID=A0A841G1R4_9ACTN|nr:hypothetical protein [Phytomonospora endophytica]